MSYLVQELRPVGRRGVASVASVALRARPLRNPRAEGARASHSPRTAANPPVCKILDFGKFKYEKKKQESKRRASQTVVELKEIKLRPGTDDHDIAFKVRHAREFLQEGHKVKFTVRFRGRQITHPEVARAQLDLIMGQLQDLAVIESRAAFEARAMCLLVAPK